jgi:asparagine synthase (glutamine-hydrolysing)
MSVQFGLWNFDGKPADRAYLDKISPVLAPYGPDDRGIHLKDNIGILYNAFHTTSESRREAQPCSLASGIVLSWDGRLDNRSELIGLLTDVLATGSTDVEIVGAAYQRWGTDCLAKLLGDWALAIWNPHTRSVILAKDFAGKRHLYYTVDDNRLTWSTVLDPLVMFSGKRLELCEEYIAGWLGFFPAAHLTPYIGIHAVPPASFVVIQPGKVEIRKYWDFDTEKRLRYRTDAEYEEHFRSVFTQAVRRSLRSDRTVGAHLSGGRDSTSIVCMADTIFANGAFPSPGLETISFYDDSEPNWNERPYFTIVEKRRGRSGCHIDVSSPEPFNFNIQNDRFATTPSGDGHSTDRRFSDFLSLNGIRVILSGTGGDEATGGVPTPLPELEDLIATRQFRKLAHQLTVWALNKRKPWFHLLFQAIGAFFPPSMAGVAKNRRPAPWLNGDFVKRNLKALQGYEVRLKLHGSLPTFQENLATFEGVCRQLASSVLPTNPAYETRYPYLDRDLLEFLYAVPREQLVRPGQSRSLMRRALVNIVPNEILNRRRKASVSRKPALALHLANSQLSVPDRILLTDSIGITDSTKFLKILQDASAGLGIPLVKLIRTLSLEYWLIGIRGNRLRNSDLENKDACSPVLNLISAD